MERPYTLALLARAPTPGRSKTRLIPRLGPAGAANFAQAALTDLLHLISPITSCRRILFYTPASSKADLQALLEKESLQTSWELHPQPDAGDLGERLSAALEHAQQTSPQAGGRGAVTFIGMDCFDLTLSSIQSSMKVVSTSTDRAHMVAALDGGYVLLTVPLSCRGDEIFSQIEWSTDRTGQMQIQRLRDAGIECELTEPLHDVDEPEDLDRLWRDRESKEGNFPRTMEFLKKAMPQEMDNENK